MGKEQNLARGLSAQAALALATAHHADILWDQTAQSPYFYYWAPNGKRHMVWFEDARSVMLKYDLAKRYGLRGVSYWVLGNEFPQNWGVLNSAFGITH